MTPAVARWYQAAAEYVPASRGDVVKVRAVAFSLGQLADYWTGALVASTGDIARHCGLGRNTVSRILADLSRAGLLRTDKAHGNGKPASRCLTIRNCSAPVQSPRYSRGGNCTAVVQSKEAKEGSSEYISRHASHERARRRENVVRLDPRRGELGALIAETRGNLRTARERGPRLRSDISSEGTQT